MMAAVWYYGYIQTSLDWYWLLGGGVFAGLLTFKLFSGPLRKVLTLLKYIIIIGTLFAAIAFILKIVQDNS